MATITFDAAEIGEWRINARQLHALLETAHRLTAQILTSSGIGHGAISHSYTQAPASLAVTVASPVGDVGAALRSVVSVAVADPRRVADALFVEEPALVALNVRLARKDEAARVDSVAVREALQAHPWRTKTWPEMKSVVDAAFSNPAQRRIVKVLLASALSGGQIPRD